MDSTVYTFHNGLGNGEQWHERLTEWWWKRRGLEFVPMQNDWYGNEPYAAQLAQDVEQTAELANRYNTIVQLGSSAGCSHVLNIRSDVIERGVDPNQLVTILCHGWLKPPETEDEKAVLDKRLRLDVVAGRKPPAPRFSEALAMLEQTLEGLGSQDKRRILILTQLNDLVVPRSVRLIPGIKSRTSLTFGHSGGYIAHLFADIGRITRFVEKVTSEEKVS